MRTKAKIGEFDSYASLAYEREFSAKADAINANNKQPYSHALGLKTTAAWLKSAQTTKSKTLRVLSLA